MSYKPTVFNQLFNFIPRHVFEKSVKNYNADRYAKTFKAWHQFLLLIYAQKWPRFLHQSVVSLSYAA